MKNKQTKKMIPKKVTKIEVTNPQEKELTKLRRKVLDQGNTIYDLQNRVRTLGDVNRILRSDAETQDEYLRSMTLIKRIKFLFTKDY